jgi:hypothetical protein
MARLYQICKAPKTWRDFPKGSHNDTVAEPGYFLFINNFLEKVVKA